jgi:tRNA 2-thiocytidine biosynthesis protein TtcA
MRYPTSVMEQPRLPIHLPIAKPPWTQLGRKLESMCRKALYEFDLLDDQERLAIALSGGKDSLTLLFLLKAILGKGFPQKQLIAIHVDGAFSCGASLGQAFLPAICRELNVEFVSVKSTQEERKLECYSCSRERRRLIFEAAKQAGAKTIAFGHHRDDHVQTLLMNLLHKGEFAGNLPKVPMVHYGVTIIRPLIFISEEEIISFAKLYGFARITCQCPIGQNSLRKKTHKLVQELEQIYPNARANLASASLLYGSNKALRP